MIVTNWQPATPFKVFVIGADFSHGESDASPDDYWVQECPFLSMETRIVNGEIYYNVLYWDQSYECVCAFDKDLGNGTEATVAIPAIATQSQIDDIIGNTKTAMFHVYQEKNKKK